MAEKNECPICWNPIPDGSECTCTPPHVAGLTPDGPWVVIARERDVPLPTEKRGPVSVWGFDDEDGMLFSIPEDIANKPGIVARRLLYLAAALNDYAVELSRDRGRETKH